MRLTRSGCRLLATGACGRILRVLGAASSELDRSTLTLFVLCYTKSSPAIGRAASRDILGSILSGLDAWLGYLNRTSSACSSHVPVCTCRSPISRTDSIIIGLACLRCGSVRVCVFRLARGWAEGRRHVTVIVFSLKLFAPTPANQNSPVSPPSSFHHHFLQPKRSSKLPIQPSHQMARKRSRRSRSGASLPPCQFCLPAPAYPKPEGGLLRVSYLDL